MRAKRDNGDGSIRQRKDGSWETRISTNDGRKSFYGKTKAEVKGKLQEYKRLTARGYSEVKKITVSEYMENWLITYKKHMVKASTYDRIESTYVHHIKPTIGHRQMGNIDSRDIQLMINEKVNPSKKERKPMSRSSVKKILELLDSCFEFAVKSGDMNLNPMKFVQIPHTDKFITKTKEMFALSSEELNALKLIADAKLHNGQPLYRYAYVYMIMLNTGVRVGEMLAVKWEDIDFDNKLMHVNKSVMSNIKNRDSSSKKRKQVISSTKTKNGVRSIPLNESSIYYLRCLRQYNIDHNIVSDNVVCTRNGSMLTARNLQRTFDTVLAKANIPHCGLHVLRHTFGSMLLQKGVDISVISRLMGHSSPQITREKYIHIYKEQKVNAVELLDFI